MFALVFTSLQDEFKSTIKKYRDKAGAQVALINSNPILKKSYTDFNQGRLINLFDVLSLIAGAKKIKNIERYGVTREIIKAKFTEKFYGVEQIHQVLVEFGLDSEERTTLVYSQHHTVASLIPIIVHLSTLHRDASHNSFTQEQALTIVCVAQILKPYMIAVEIEQSEPLLTLERMQATSEPLQSAAALIKQYNPQQSPLCHRPILYF